MAPIWKGLLTFGLVSLPVELRRAVRREVLRFHLLHEADHAPVRYERVCSADGRTLAWDDIVKGYEYERGKYVVLTDEDFRAAALATSPALEILDFVAAADIDRRYFDAPYFLVPGKGGDRAYAVLRDAMRRTGTVGLGTIILHQKQHLAGVMVVGDALVVELMRFAGDLVNPRDYHFPSSEGVRAAEVSMAEQLIASLRGPFDATKYTDRYHANLQRIVRAKLEGKHVSLAGRAREAAETKVIDLMERLQQSLARGGKPKRGAASRRAGTRPRRSRSA